MKISKFFFALAAFGFLGTALVFQGCGDGSKKKDKTGASAGSAQTTSDDDSDDEGAGDSEGESAVAFYNNNLGFRGASQSVFENICKAIEKSEEFIERSSSKPSWNSVVSPTSQISKIPTVKFGAPADFGKENKEYINKRIDAVKADVAELLKEIDAMKKYYSAEDYKDDWHKAFLMAKPRFETLMGRIAKNNKEVYKLADKLSEEIDRKNVAKMPQGVFILNMRYVIDKVKDRADIILDNDLEDARYGCGVSDEEKVEMLKKTAPICDKYEALSKQLDEMVAKYKDIDKGKIKDTPLAKTYDEFFAKYEKSTEDSRRIIRELRERGYTNEQNTIAGMVGELVRSHNEFLERLQGK